MREHEYKGQKIVEDENGMFRLFLFDNPETMEGVSEIPFKSLNLAKMAVDSYIGKSTIVDPELYDHDIYYVEEAKNGKKQINLQRFYYWEEDYITCTEFTGIRFHKLPVTREMVEEAEQDSKQYTYYQNEGDVADDLENCIRLPITEVTQKTPCGKYIDLPSK